MSILMLQEHLVVSITMSLSNSIILGICTLSSNFWPHLSSRASLSQGLIAKTHPFWQLIATLAISNYVTKLADAVLTSILVQCLVLDFKNPDKILTNSTSRLNLGTSVKTPNIIETPVACACVLNSLGLVRNLRIEAHS